jgi:hypothetical protein
VSWPVGMAAVMQHDNIPREHTRVLSLDGGTKVSEGSTVALRIDGDVRVLHWEHWHLTMSHCPHSLQCTLSVIQLVANCWCVIHTTA